MLSALLHCVVMTPICWLEAACRPANDQVRKFSTSQGAQQGHAMRTFQLCVRRPRLHVWFAESRGAGGVKMYGAILVKAEATEACTGCILPIKRCPPGALYRAHINCRRA